MQPLQSSGSLCRCSGTGSSDAISEITARPPFFSTRKISEKSAAFARAAHVVSVDLEAQTVTSPSGAVFRFEIDPKRKDKMLKGLDAIGETLEAKADIDVYESKRALGQPWLEGA